MLPLRAQIFGSFLAALLCGALLSLAFSPAQSELERKSQPFTTQAGMLAVSLRLHRQAAPEILVLQPLESGRISTLLPGDYALELLDGQGRSLYSLPFQAVFLRSGEPPELLDELRLVLVIPLTSQARSVRLSGPQGQAEMALPAGQALP